MRVVYLKVGRPPVVKDIDGSLESMQELVGGYIQSVPLSYNTALVCDEDGKMKGSALIMEFQDRAALDDYLAGEPYVVEGVWQKLVVEPMNVVLVNGEKRQ